MCCKLENESGAPILDMVFSKSVEPEKWTRKDEAVYAVSLRLGFQGIGT